VLVTLLSDAHGSGCTTTIPAPRTRGIVGEYRFVRRSIGADVPDATLLAGLAAWEALFGAISLEVFGHVDTVFTDPGTHFAALTDMLGRQLLGLD